MVALVLNQTVSTQTTPSISVDGGLSPGRYRIQLVVTDTTNGTSAPTFVQVTIVALPPPPPPPPGGPGTHPQQPLPPIILQPVPPDPPVILQPQPPVVQSPVIQPPVVQPPGLQPHPPIVLPHVDPPQPPN